VRAAQAIKDFDNVCDTKAILKISLYSFDKFIGVFEFYKSSILEVRDMPCFFRNY